MCYRCVAPLLVFWLLASQCVAGERVWWSPGASSYEVVPAWVTWWEAKEAAEAKGGYLVAIDSTAENEFVLELAKKTIGPDGKGVYLGGYLPPGSDDIGTGWVWLSGEKWNYTNWDPAYDGKPADPYWGDHHKEGSEGGVLMYLDSASGAWGNYTTSAADQDGYVIEYDDEPPIFVDGVDAPAESQFFLGSSVETSQMDRTYGLPSSSERVPTSSYERGPLKPRFRCRGYRRSHCILRFEP